MTSNVSGTLSARSSTISKASLSAEVEVQNEGTFSLPATVNLDADGSMTISLDDSPAELTLEGFLNEDGSLGVFTTSYAENGQDPEELGLANLVELTEG